MSKSARPTSYSRGRALRNRRIKTSCSALSTFDISAKKWCTDTPHGQAKRPFHTMFTLTPRPFALLSSHIAFTNPQRTWRHWSLLVQIVRFTCPRRRTFSNATFASLQRGASCWRLISASRHSRCECLSNQHVFV